LYFGLGLAEADRGHKRRVKIADAVGLIGLGADIDIQGEGHKQTALSPDEASALSILDAAALPPTLVDNSGHGVQALWLFPVPWRFADAAEQERAIALGYTWQAYIRALAVEHGWKLDNVGDLSRIFRVPGTVNAKIRARPVDARLLRVSPERRYTPDQLEAVCAPYAAQGRQDRATGNGTVDGSVDRFHKNNPCPICGGYQEMPVGIGERCWGFLTRSGDAAFCTREEFAGDLEPKVLSIGGEVWLHRLGKACGCGQRHSPTREREIVVRRLSDIVAERTTWLMRGYVPLGELTLNAAPGGVGKTHINFELLVRTAAGLPMPGDLATSLPHAAPVAVVTSENHPSKVMRPELEATARALLPRDRVVASPN
jgi:AAA domain